MEAVYIKGKRSGYSPDSCGATMTVRELIERLEEFDQNLPVYLINDNGYTYGNITDYDVQHSEEWE